MKEKIKIPKWMKKKMKENVDEIKKKLDSGEMKVEDLGRNC